MEFLYKTRQPFINRSNLKRPMRIPVPILLYHSISDESTAKFARWTVSPKLFKSHMTYLREAGFYPITVTDFALGLNNWSLYSLLKPVVITFDDGYEDFYYQALPILEQCGLKATIYIATQYVGMQSFWLQSEGGSRQMMSWEQIRSLPSYGMECGAHGHTHQQLDILPAEFAMRDILLSKEILEDHLGHPIYTFAYPHGYHSQRIKTMVQKAGFASACAVKDALSSSEDDPFALARVIISPSTDLETFKLIVEGKNLPVSPYPEKVRTKAWRGMRWLFNHISLLM